MAIKVPIKKTAAGKTLFPQGFNRAILVAAEEHSTRNNQSIRLTLRNGGYEHKEDLWLSDGAQARLTMMAKRLGLIDASDSAPEDQEADFESAVGKELVIDIEHEKDQNEQVVSKISYSGLWSIDHEDKKVRAYLNTEAGKVPAVNNGKPAGGDTGSNGNGKKPAEDDLSDI